MFPRRQFLAGSIGLAGAALLAGCSGDDGGDSSDRTTTTVPGRAGGPGGNAGEPLAAPGTAGLVDEDVWQQRVDAYLSFASEELHPDNPVGIAVHLVRAHREPGYSWDADQVSVAALQDVWDQIDTWQDTRDFNLMYLHWVLHLGRGDTPATTVPPEVIDAIGERLRANRYRYDDPLPADRIDDQWFWSENHVVIGLVNEYLAGRRFADQTFAVTGLTGEEHAKRSRPRILEWIHERARFGFFEWHSHVYMLKNISPLVTLIELDDDPELVRAAGMALDLCLLDVAAHTHAGTYTASRGRTYKKDKMRSTDEDTFGTAKLVFDDTDAPYPSRTDTGATFLCAAQRYRPPQLLLDVATVDAPGVTRERHGIWVDGSAPVTDAPKAPFGYDFDDTANLTFWWSQGAIGMWQVADISLAEAEEHRLFEAPSFAQIKLLSDLNGGDPERIKAWEQANHDIVNFGHLREANTYAWRGDAVSLASVVDHRFGQMRDQIHAWQATIDDQALVFTTHPGPDLPESTDWDEDGGEPGYWTGEASVPRIAQHEQAAIVIYQPAWDESTDSLLWSVFGYRPFTHAFVPQERFDEVVQVRNWTVARKGRGAIALWSWRAPTWRTYDPARSATGGMTKPFDLVAEGGADNVWLVEVAEGSTAELDSWAESVLSFDPDVVRDDDGFQVEWSPESSDEILSFGSSGPFRVGREEQPLADFPRHDSRFGTVERLATRYALASAGAKLDLDFEAGTRTIA